MQKGGAVEIGAGDAVVDMPDGVQQSMGPKALLRRLDLSQCTPEDNLLVQEWLTAADSMKAEEEGPLKPVDQTLKMRWHGSVGLAHLVLSHYGSFHEWRDHMDFNSDRNETYLHDHRSDTVWKEIVTLLSDEIEVETLRAIRTSPVYGLSFDTKKRDLAIVIHYLDARMAKFEFRSLPLARIKIGGENAPGLTNAICDFLQEQNIDIARLGAVGADGCGTTGVMTAEELKVDPTGAEEQSNVCKLLASVVSVPVFLSVRSFSECVLQCFAARVCWQW